jgi:pilus assembly protein CpaE
MSDNEILLSVVDDPGIKAWLERVVDDPFRLEYVSRADLTRVLRLLEATTAHLVLVEVNETDLDQSLAIITALTSARPWITVITVCIRANQDLLLQSMRAGARDCFLAGHDATEIRDRLRRHQLVRSGHYGDENRSSVSNLTLVTGADPTVDTRFLAQNLAQGVNQRNPGQRCLAIDTQLRERGVFYLDTGTDFTLDHLLTSPETLDETLIDTALEEYRPGLRLLAGGSTGMALDGDRSADLFIALNRLMQMFDHIIINVAAVQSSHWVRALGIHTRHLLVVMHPLVDHAHAARGLIQDWRAHLGRDSLMALVIDGHDSGVPPSTEELRDTVGIELAGTLPMDWRHRLLAINAGEPITEQSPRCAYSRAINALLEHMDGDADGGLARRGLFARLRGG